MLMVDWKVYHRFEVWPWIFFHIASSTTYFNEILPLLQWNTSTYSKIIKTYFKDTSSTYFNKILPYTSLRYFTIFQDTSTYIK